MAITRIESEAFAHKNLQNVTFESPSELTYVGANAFLGNNAEEIILPTESTFGTRVESWKNTENVFTPIIRSNEESSKIARDVMTFNFKPRQVEKLNRGLVAMQSSNGIFLSWRLLGTDPRDIAFNIYKNGTLLNSEPHNGASNFIDSNETVDDKYKVEDLHVSSRHLSRKIKAITGTTPSVLITKIKMEKATELLGTTDMNIAEIGYLIGFNEPSNFSRTFTKYYGYPPSKFVRR